MYSLVAEIDAPACLTVAYKNAISAYWQAVKTLRFLHTSGEVTMALTQMLSIFEFPISITAPTV
jgi:hypothetical protein